MVIKMWCVSQILVACLDFNLLNMPQALYLWLIFLRYLDIGFCSIGYGLDFFATLLGLELEFSLVFGC